MARKKERQTWWAITLLIIILGCFVVGLLWFLHEVGLWSLSSGLNVPCSDVLCQMRKPLEYYKS